MNCSLKYSWVFFAEYWVWKVTKLRWEKNHKLIPWHFVMNENKPRIVIFRWSWWKKTCHQKPATAFTVSNYLQSFSPSVDKLIDKDKISDHVEGGNSTRRHLLFAAFFLRFIAIRRIPFMKDETWSTFRAQILVSRRHTFLSAFEFLTAKVEFDTGSATQ